MNNRTNSNPNEIPLLKEDSHHASSRSSALHSLKSIKNFFSRRISIWEQLPDREINLNEECPPKLYKDNKINTSKYTCISFIPKNLTEQFSKRANLYFLIIGFLQTIDEISTSGGVPVIFFPLTLIIIVSSIKDLFEDFKRKRSDNQENNRKILVLDKNIGNFVQKKWEDLKVGNIIKIMENEYFPADLLVLKTSDPKNLCYIETKNLDGETNLKRKTVAKDLSFFLNLNDFQVTFFLYFFETLKLDFKTE